MAPGKEGLTKLLAILAARTDLDVSPQAHPGPGFVQGDAIPAFVVQRESLEGLLHLLFESLSQFLVEFIMHDEMRCSPWLEGYSDKYRSGKLKKKIRAGKRKNNKTQGENRKKSVLMIRPLYYKPRKFMLGKEEKGYNMEKAIELLKLPRLQGSNSG